MGKNILGQLHKEVIHPLSKIHRRHKHHLGSVRHFVPKYKRFVETVQRLPHGVEKVRMDITDKLHAHMA
jgi:hypothetical protein